MTEISSLCDLTSLEELWLSRNCIDAPQFLNLSQLSSVSHFVGSSNPWCSHEHYKTVLLSMFENCQTFDCGRITEHDLDEAAEFAVSTDGKGVFHKLKFTILQSENQSYFKQKLFNKEAKSASSRASQAGRKKINSKRYNNDNSNSMATSVAVLTNPKDLRRHVNSRKKMMSSTSSPAKRSSRSASPTQRSPMSMKSTKTTKSNVTSISSIPKSPPGATLATGERDMAGEKRASSA